MKIKTSGFTLIELLIAVVIIGILSSIAISNYTDSINRSKRADAQGALLGVAQALERFYANNSTYCGAAGTQPPTAATIAACATGAPTVYAATVPGTGTAYYNLRITTLAQNNYTLEAQRAGSMVSDKCGTLTLGANGAQGVSGSTGGMTAVTCWKK